MFIDDTQLSHKQFLVDFQNYPYADRPLNTAKAQSYLSAIQVQFYDQADVFDHFLNILKEFQSKSIDIPDVIIRIFKLFNGRLALMQDFNTFLPVGYRIECAPDAYNSSSITVTSPTGTKMLSTNNGPGQKMIQWSTGPVPSAVIPSGSGPDMQLPSTEAGGIHDDRAFEYPDSRRSNAILIAMLVDDPQSPVGPQSYPSKDRPLNVTDALNYLDAVKAQLHDQPDVYNQFLDIMKAFKHELIDTPSVIKRVAQLFNGHSALIQGFNTFLPVGYRIECSTDALDSSYITVTTPTGTMIQTTNNGPGQGPILWSTGPVPGATIPSTPESSIPSPSQEASGTYDGRAIEPAVQYVLKVKNRCDPETYRQFLDILSRYHHIDEEGVLRQIARLFKDAPDLRADLRAFMPKRRWQLLDESQPPPVPTPSDIQCDLETYRKLQEVLSRYRQQPNTFDEKDLLLHIACLVDDLSVEPT